MTFQNSPRAIENIWGASVAVPGPFVPRLKPENQSLNWLAHLRDVRLHLRNRGDADAGRQMLLDRVHLRHLALGDHGHGEVEEDPRVGRAPRRSRLCARPLPVRQSRQFLGTNEHPNPNTLQHNLLNRQASR